MLRTGPDSKDWLNVEAKVFHLGQRQQQASPKLSLGECHGQIIKGKEVFTSKRVTWG